MSKPSFIPDTDWNTVQSICKSYGVDPYFIAAIGWHETHWGQLGAGKIGWILGFGYFPGSTVAEKYKGLVNQLNGACKMIGDYLKTPITLQNVTDFATGHWKSGAPEAWARSVYSIYTSLGGSYEPPKTDTEIQDLSKRISELEQKVTVDIDTGIVDLKKRVSWLEMIANFVKEFFNSLGKEL